MAALKNLVQNALDENRMMVLGVQVLIGFNYRAPLEQGFQTLPRAAQLMKLSSLSLLLVTFALLLLPSADHRLCEHGEDTPQFHAFTTRVASLALFGFAAALGLDLAVAAFKLGGVSAALAAGLAAGAAALAFWYGIELVARAARKEEKQVPPKPEKASVSDKIRHVLTEARVVLPGAQALLGFQLMTTLMLAFDKLPSTMKWIHFASLGFMALAIVLLITPAAWHRIVERGEETERFHRFASAMVVAALVPLALSMAGDFFVVAHKVTESTPLALAMAGGALALFFGLWFGVTLARRLAGAASPGSRARLA